MEEIDVAGAFYGRTEQFTKAGQLYNASRRAFGSTLKDLRQAQAERMKAEPSVTAAPAVTAAPVTEPRLEGAAPESTPAKPLAPELVSFPVSHLPVRPAASAEPLTPEKGEHDPPIAA